MDTNTKWKYIFLGIGMLLVVIVLVYLRVAADYHVSVMSLLPSSPRPIYITPPPQEPVPPPVQRFTAANGAKVYVITGRFVTAPAYNAQQVLQGDFVIDKDPTNHRIPVVMVRKTDTMSVTESDGSFAGKTTVSNLTGENLRPFIVVNAQVQLRVYPVGSTKSQDYIEEQRVLDTIVAGKWSIPDGFILHPQTFGFVAISKNRGI